MILETVRPPLSMTIRVTLITLVASVDALARFDAKKRLLSFSDVLEKLPPSDQKRGCNIEVCVS